MRKVAILDDADDLNEEAANAFLKTLEEPPPGAVLILIGTSAEVQLQTIVSRCQVVRFDPLSAADVAELLLEQGVARDADDAARLAALGDGSLRRALGLADAGLERFRRALIDELAADHGFDPPALARRVLDHVKQAGKESVDQRRRASLLVGELSRFFRGVLWQTAGLEPPCPDPDDRRAAESVAGAARARGRPGPGRPLPRGRLPHPAPARHEPHPRVARPRPGEAAQRPRLIAGDRPSPFASPRGTLNRATFRPGRRANAVAAASDRLQ